jgi:hypothetical protein
MTMTINEQALQSYVEELAQLYRWLVYHTHDSRHSAAGFPDLVLVCPRRQRVIFAELKGANGKLRAEQVIWLEALQVCPGVEAYLWRPEDMPDLVEVLR